MLMKLNTKIYAKSVLTKERMNVKKEIGCDGIEIQLFAEFIDGELGHYFDESIAAHPLL